MIKKIINLFICCSVCCFASIKVVGANEDTNIIAQNFINIVKLDDPETLAKYIVYPLEREGIAPSIENEQEFVEKYDMLFDDDLKKAIVDSKPEDWQHGGWRRVMFNSGLLWLNYEGKLTALHTISAEEQKYADSLARKDKENLYPALFKCLHI